MHACEQTNLVETPTKHRLVCQSWKEVTLKLRCTANPGWSVQDKRKCRASSIGCSLSACEKASWSPDAGLAHQRGSMMNSRTMWQEFISQLRAAPRSRTNLLLGWPQARTKPPHRHRGRPHWRRHLCNWTWNVSNAVNMGISQKGASSIFPFSFSKQQIDIQSSPSGERRVSGQRKWRCWALELRADETMKIHGEAPSWLIPDQLHDHYIKAHLTNCCTIARNSHIWAFDFLPSPQPFRLQRQWCREIGKILRCAERPNLVKSEGNVSAVSTSTCQYPQVYNFTCSVFCSKHGPMKTLQTSGVSRSPRDELWPWSFLLQSAWASARTAESWCAFHVGNSMDQKETQDE